MKKKKAGIRGEVKRAYYLGFLERVDAPWGLDKAPSIKTPTYKEYKRNRSYFMFDAVRADNFDQASQDLPANLAYIFLTTTWNKFHAMLATGNRKADTENFPTEGSWYLLELVERKGGPRTWIAKVNKHGAPKIRGNRPSKWRLDKIRFITDTDTDAGRGTRIEDVARVELVARPPIPDFDGGSDRYINDIKPYLLANFYLAPSGKAGPPKPFRNLRLDEVIAIDVGHGSCVALCKNGKVSAYFDVGYPMNCNLKSLPKKIDSLMPGKNCMVILSHWDFDHFGLATKEVHLKRLPWLAPSRHMGANAKKLAKSLGPRLTKVRQDIPFTMQNPELAWGGGKNKNNTGIIGLVRLKKKKILLAADASYGSIPASFKEQLTALTIPHHGSQSRDDVPAPASPRSSVAMVCGGQKNRYGHPNEDVLDAHKKQGWRINATGKINSVLTRGNKNL